MINLNGLGRKQEWLNRRNILAYMEGMKKTPKNISQYARCPGRSTNCALLEHTTCCTVDTVAQIRLRRPRGVGDPMVQG
jgi:hypothetical protein